MGHGLHGYAIDLHDLSQHVGGKDLEQMNRLLTRFESVVELHKKWAHSHGSENLLPLEEAMEWLFVSPVTSFDDRVANVGYAMEIICYHFGEHINIGKKGISSLRDMTTSDLHRMIEPIRSRLRGIELDGCADLETALIRRNLAGIENQAAYPGTGYLTLKELEQLSEAMADAGTNGAPETWPWYPLLLLFHGAIERKRDLVTFYY